MAGYWPQAGLALGLLLSAPRRAWPALFAAVLAAHLVADRCTVATPLATSIGYGAVNVLQPALGAWVVQRHLGTAEQPLRLRDVREVVALVVLAAVLVNALGSSLGAALALNTGQPFFETWRLWWIADGLGMILVAPVVLTWARERPPWDPEQQTSRLLEGLVLSATVGLTSAITFSSAGGAPLTQPYLLLPVLLWASLRFGVRGAATASLGTAVVAAWLGTPGEALGAAAARAALLEVQAFLGVTTLTMLVLAAVVAERRRSEAALRESESSLAMAREAAQFGEWVTDLSTLHFQCSEALARLFGLDSASPRERFLDRIHPDDRSALQDASAETARSGRPFARQVRIVRPDGGARHLHVRGRRIHDAARGVDVLYGSAFDVTDVTRAQEALAESEQRYRDLFENAPLGLGVVDLSGAFLACNPAMLAPGGYEGDPPQDLPSLFADPAEGQDAILADRGAVLRREVRLRRRDGDDYPALLSLNPITLHGRRCWLVMVEDATERSRSEAERRDLEAQLRHAQKLEAVGTLAAGVAHDFNNVLTAIYGYLDLAQRLGGGERVEEPLRGIRQAADQAAAVTQSLLTFSRKATSEKAPVDLARLVREEAAFVGRVVPASIQVTTEVPGDEELWVEANATQLLQILVNLAVNSRDAMPDGGPLRVAARPGALEPGGAADDAAHLIVEDAGAGIPADMRERVFEPFFTTKPREQGTGLGLAVVHGIVSEHGGRVELRSEVEQGTRITIVLPRCSAPPPRPSHAAEPSAAHEGGGERILVAEDNEQVGDLLASALRAAGYQVQLVRDGDAALAALTAEAPPDLAVLDVDLPRRSGLDCLRALRAAASSLPVLLVTGDVALALEAPDEAATLLYKPLRTDDLLARVRRSLAARARRPTASEAPAEARGAGGPEVVSA